MLKKLLVVALLAAMSLGVLGMSGLSLADSKQPATSAPEVLVSDDNEEPGITGTLHVDSRVSAYIRVYVNGQYRGTIPPWGDIYPFVGDSSFDFTTLYAETNDGRFWSRTVSSGTSSYHWVLYP